MADAKKAFDFECDGTVRDTEYEALKGYSSIDSREGLVPTFEKRTERVQAEPKRNAPGKMVDREYKVLVRLRGRIAPGQLATLKGLMRGSKKSA